MAPIGVGAAVAYTVGHTGIGRARQSAEAAADALCGADRLHRRRAAADRAAVPGAAEALHQGRSRTGNDCFRAPPAPKRRCPAPWKRWRPSACRGRSSRSSSRRATASISTGGSLYLSVAAIFVAQVAGMHLSLGQQLMIMLTLMLTSKGVAGVSRAALVILLATATSIGLPTEPVFLLLGVDQLARHGTHRRQCPGKLPGKPW